MKKFVIQSAKGSHSVVEVECEVMPKYYASGLPEGRWMAKITSPAFLYEKDFNNKLVPPVWCWWAFQDSVADCMEFLETLFRESIVRNGEKQARIAGVTYEPLSENDMDQLVVQKLNQVKVIML